MEEPSLFLTVIINKIFGKVVLALMGVLGIHPANPHEPIPQHVVFVLVVTTLVALLLRLLARKVNLVPTPLQSVGETIVGMFKSTVEDMIGEKGRPYIPVIGTVGLFVFFCNIAGLFPGMMSPTSNLNVTAAAAVFVFLYYHWQGIKAHGLGKYVKHFGGPYFPYLAWLFFPIEIISQFSRPLSLSLRLFGNIMGEDMVILVLTSLIPFVVPLPMMALAIFTSFVQAMVFPVLTTIYLAGALEEEEEEEEEPAHAH